MRVPIVAVVVGLKAAAPVELAETSLQNILKNLFGHLVSSIYLDVDDAARTASCGTDANLRSAESRVVASIAVLETTDNRTLII